MILNKRQKYCIKIENSKFRQTSKLNRILLLTSILNLSTGVYGQNKEDKSSAWTNWFRDSAPPPSSLVQNSRKAFAAPIQNEYETITNGPDINAPYKPPNLRSWQSESVNN